METVREFIFGDSKITADGDCRHEFKRHLFLRRKAMTNIDSILKSRDITLSTKVLLVKVVSFLLVRHRCEFSSIQLFSHVRLFVTPWRPPCPSPMPRVYPNSCPLSWWCHPTILSPVVTFSSCLQSFAISGSFQMSKLFISGSQNNGSFSFNISPSKEHPGLISLRMDWWISLQSKGLSRIFSNTTVQKHQFFCTQLSL